jgi:preprotein translocase subunit SecF
MEIIRPGTQINFVGYRNAAALGSLALIAIGLVASFFRGGPNLGIDFSGGSLVHVRFAKPTTTEEVRGVLKQTDLSAATIQSVQGDASEYLIRLPLGTSEVETVTKTVTTSLTGRFGADQVDILRVEAVGPLVGQVLREKALLAISFATVMMGIYIWARFEWRFGVGAGVALLHDVLLTIAALIVWNYEFDLTVVAALLTVVGFSVNDTVIVSDRIRENMRKDRRSSLSSIINRSINETLSRTVLTTGTGLFVVFALFALGGTVIHGFAFTLLIGFFVGTYSSIYIATPVILFFEGARPTAGRRA